MTHKCSKEFLIFTEQIYKLDEVEKAGRDKRLEKG